MFIKVTEFDTNLIITVMVDKIGYFQELETKPGTAVRVVGGVIYVKETPEQIEQLICEATGYETPEMQRETWQKKVEVNRKISDILDRK